MAQNHAHGNPGGSTTVGQNWGQVQDQFVVATSAMTLMEGPSLLLSIRDWE